VETLLGRLNLPIDLANEPLEPALDLLRLDKKRRGSKIRFVLVRQVGEVEFQELELSELTALSRALVRTGRSARR
jgi:3-dehydroquinate synthetase